MSLLESIEDSKTKTRVLFFDGPIGTGIRDLAGRIFQPQDYAKDVSSPGMGILKTFYRQRSTNPVDFVKTPTFLISPLSSPGENYYGLIKKLCDVTHEYSPGAYVAGNIGPLDPAIGERDVVKIYQFWIQALERGSVDLILADTINRASQAVTIAKACLEANIPLILSMHATPEGALLCGTPLQQVVSELSTVAGSLLGKTIFLGLNCQKISVLYELCKMLPGGFYLAPNGDLDPVCQYYTQLKQAGMGFFGGCCGMKEEAYLSLIKE